jgi:hypothetical protein
MLRMPGLLPREHGCGQCGGQMEVWEPRPERLGGAQEWLQPKGKWRLRIVRRPWWLGPFANQYFEWCFTFDEPLTAPPGGEVIFAFPTPPGQHIYIKEAR